MGEDLMNPERIRSQKDQQRAWLQQQIRERQSAENDKRQAERNIQAAIEARDRRSLEMDEAERAARRQIQSSAARFNLNLVKRARILFRALQFFMFPFNRRQRRKNVSASHGNVKMTKTTWLRFTTI